MGLFIAIEGGDGSGKGTQAAKLAERVSAAGYDVMSVSFPQYGKPSAAIVSRYLNGEYGAANDIHPDLASLPYAIDRLAASSDIRNHLSRPRSIVIADRYVASNLAHQGTKLSDPTDRQSFYETLQELEYSVMQLPKPDINIVLLVPSSIAQTNVDQKTARSYTDKKRDIHEADVNHLEAAKSNYEELCNLYPNEYTRVECLEDDHMRSIDDIHEDIWNIVNSISGD